MGGLPPVPPVPFDECPACGQVAARRPDGRCGFCHPLFEAMPGGPVTTAPLSSMVGAYVDEWRRGRPSRRGTRNRPADAVEPVGAYESLAALSGLAESVVRNVRHGRSKTVPAPIADALVAALGAPQAYYDGTLAGLTGPPA